MEIIDIQRTIGSLVQRNCRCQMADKEEIIQDLVLYFLEKPDGVDKAMREGYLLQYLTNAVKRRYSSYLSGKKFVSLDDYEQ